MYDESVGWFNCYSCPVKVRYLMSGTRPNLEIVYITFYMDNFSIELTVDDQVTRLFDGPKVPVFGFISSPVVQLNYLIDITPANARDWLTKLLNLKTFA